MTYSSEKLIEVQRAGYIECMHRGYIAVVNDEGTLLHALGNPNHIIFARSAAKPLQALAVLDHGAINTYKFDDREVALMCASHNGESIHVESVQNMLNQLDATEDQLSCGAHYPFHKDSAVAMQKNRIEAGNLHNNCSGKHAGMIALARMLHAPIEGYALPQHPVQIEMKQVIAEMAELQVADIHTGIDGCGVPVFALPLSRLALSYAKLGTGNNCSETRQRSASIIRRALASYPEYLAGDDRYDTLLIRVTSGRILGKMGAEGVFALCIPTKKIGIAIKVEDGNFRALYPTITETLKQLQFISEAEHESLQKWHNPVIHNHAGTEVGLIVPSFIL